MKSELILKGLFYPFVVLFDLPARISNWCKIRILNNHKKYSIFGKIEESKNIAVLVTFPGTSTFESVERLANWIEEAGYLLIVVINENSKATEWKSRLFNDHRIIVLRPNIGEDFGAYKQAIKIISPFKKSIRNLVIANDSMMYAPKSREWVMKVIDINSENACTSLFLNKQGAIHAPSVLLKFGQEVLANEKFWIFWKRYYPYSNKRKIIRRGEHRLTKLIGWQSVKPVVTASLITESSTLSVSEIFQILKWVAVIDRPLLEALKFVKHADFHEHIINFAFENFQVSDSMGIFLTREFGAPLKLDLARRGLTTQNAILETLQKLDLESSEIEDLRVILSLRKSYLTRNSIQRIFE